MAPIIKLIRTDTTLDLVLWFAVLTAIMTHDSAMGMMAVYRSVSLKLSH